MEGYDLYAHLSVPHSLRLSARDRHVRAGGQRERPDGVAGDLSPDAEHYGKPVSEPEKEHHFPDPAGDRRGDQSGAVCPRVQLPVQDLRHRGDAALRRAYRREPALRRGRGAKGRLQVALRDGVCDRVRAGRRAELPALPFAPYRRPRPADLLRRRGAGRRGGPCARHERLDHFAGSGRLRAASGRRAEPRLACDHIHRRVLHPGVGRAGPSDPLRPQTLGEHGLRGGHRPDGRFPGRYVF